MNANNTTAGSGWTWVQQALALIKRWPQVFLLMGLILGVIAAVPFLGGLVVLILGPALIGGTVYAAQQADRGQTPAVGQLFQAFQDGDRIGSMVALCLPVIVASVVAGILVFIFAVGAAVGGGLTAASASNPAVLFGALGAGALILIPIVIIIMLVAWALVFFAIPRVLLDRVGAFEAMKESLGAARANMGAFLVAVLIIGVGFWLLALILGLLHLGWIGQILAVAAMYSVLGPTMYYGYRAVFGSAAAGAAETTAPPPPPPPPVEPSAPPPPPPAA